MSRTLYLLNMIRDHLAIRVRRDPILESTVVVEEAPPEETRTRHINTRQFARLRRLQETVPDCTVDNATDRNLTYPVRFEAQVQEFLDSCPRGSRRESRNHQVSSVYTPMDPTAMPGLRAARREAEKSAMTPHARMVLEAEKILTAEGELDFDDGLFPRLKARHQIPKGFNPKPILKRILNQSGLFEVSDATRSGIYSIRGSEVVVPEVIDQPEVVDPPLEIKEPEVVLENPPPDETLVEDPPPVSETNVKMEDEEFEEYDQKVPSFFPKLRKIS